MYRLHKTVVVVQRITTASSESRRVMTVVSASLTTPSKTALRPFLASVKDTIEEIQKRMFAHLIKDS